jgi:hypothetical protein
MEEGDLNFDREAGRQLHVDEILQFLNNPAHVHSKFSPITQRNISLPVPAGH